jgi:short-subunit dehydrogenase
VVVVGCSSGIGRAVAARLARAGARVALFARREAHLQTLAEEIRSAGGEADVYAGDTCDPAQVEAALTHFRRAGALDGLLYMVGVSRVCFPPELGVQEARDNLEPNFFGFLHWLERMLPGMLQRGDGFVGACTALCAYRGIPTGEAYAASKGALKNYLESLHLDLEPYGVRVFQLMPGFVESPMAALNNFTQPFMISAERAAELVLDGLEAERFRIEFGPGMSRLMRFLRVLPDWLYRLVFSDFTRRRYATERILGRLPPFTDAAGAPLEFDRYGAYVDGEGVPRIRFWRDSLEVLEPCGVGHDASQSKLTAAYRLYAVTYPVTAFLAMTFVWRGRLDPLVRHYGETLDRAAEAGEVLLDVAIGDASLTRLALGHARRPPPLLGVDLSPDMVRKAARRLRHLPEKLFYVRDVAALELPPGRFRHIGVYGGFHVFPDVEGAMAGVARMLHPEGTVRGSILTRPRSEWARAMANRFIDWGQLSNAMTEDQVDEVFAGAGLRITERRSNGEMLLFEARRA